GARVVVFAEFEFGDAARERGDEVELGGAGGGKVAVLGGESALLIVDAADEFGDDEVGVGVALAVCVGAGVGGHAVHGDGEVGAVVDVEAAEEVLVGFAAAGVLGDDEPGDDFEQFAAPQEGAGGEFA